MMELSVCEQVLELNRTFPTALEETVLRPTVNFLLTSACCFEQTRSTNQSLELQDQKELLKRKLMFEVNSLYSSRVREPAANSQTSLKQQEEHYLMHSMYQLVLSIMDRKPLEALKSERMLSFLIYFNLLTAIASFVLNASAIVIVKRRQTSQGKYLLNLSISDLLFSLPCNCK